MATSATITLEPTSAPAPAAQQTPHTERTTYWDMVEYLRDFLGADVQGVVPRVVKRAIHSALRQIPNEHNWSYFYTHGRVNLNAPQDDGTIAFDLTGGAQERMVTLTGATWPAWAASSGYLRINNVIYQIDRRVSSTVLVLDPVLTPTEDIAALTEYTLFSDTYLLPEDFISMDRGLNEDNWYGMSWVHPREWLEITRYVDSFSNSPRFFSITGSPDVPGRMALRVFPYPDTARSLDFLYKRRPRTATIDQYTTGTVTVTAGSTTVSGSQTAFTSAMEGSVIRLSTDAVNLPSGLDGDSPFSVERTVKTVTNSTSLEVDEAIDVAHTGVKYRLSDPVDVEDGAMLEAFYRLSEMHAGIQRKHKDRMVLEKAYTDAMILAKEADCRVFQVRVVGQQRGFRQRLADMPSGPDVS